jgi:hypothetical protein
MMKHNLQKYPQTLCNIKRPSIASIRDESFALLSSWVRASVGTLKAILSRRKGVILTL